MFRNHTTIVSVCAGIAQEHRKILDIQFYITEQGGSEFRAVSERNQRTLKRSAWGLGIQMFRKVAIQVTAVTTKLEILIETVGFKAVAF